MTVRGHKIIPVAGHDPNERSALWAQAHERTRGCVSGQLKDLAWVTGHGLFAWPEIWSCVFVAAAQLVLALDVLAQFDRELNTVVDDAVAVVETGAPAALDGLRIGVAQLQTTRRRIRDRVVASMTADDLATREATVRMRTMVLVARLSMLEGAGVELAANARPFGDTFESVVALQAYVLWHLERILDGLRRELHEIASKVESRSEREALRHVALGKADCGFAVLGSDRRLADALAIGARMPSMRFSIACRTLLLALRETPTVSDLIPELPSLTSRRGASERQ